MRLFSTSSTLLQIYNYKDHAVKRYLLSTITISLLAGFAHAADTAKSDAAPKSLVSGIEQQYNDPSVRAQDDFFKHLHGKWLATVEIPADKPSWGSFNKLSDDTQPQLRTIIEESAKNTANAPGSDAQKIGDFYNSYMDEKKLEELGFTPINSELAAIRVLKDKKQIPAMIAHFNQIGATAPYDIGIHQDAKDSTKYVVDIGQSGLSMPDRDYYLNKTDAKLKTIRAQYLKHVEKMLAMVGNKNAAASAKQVLALETEIAKAQWTQVQNRDPVKTYNKLSFAKLDKLVPGYDWKTYLKDTDIAGRIDYLIVSQPSYLTDFGRVLHKAPLSAWKAYFEWHLISRYANDLSKSFVDQQFAFYGTTLSGVPEMQPRWKRAVRTVDGALGESVGKIYVEKHFPADRKARMEVLVQNLLTAFKQSVDTLDWMGPATKKEALDKLSKFTPKIGYPNKWRDYSSLKISPDDLVGNVTRTVAFAYKNELNKLGKPIDRDEWGITPQTVNAYYNPELNEIVFPAAILQPPFFDANADDAVNYGGIGAVIGHEISHGFDDSGAQYDGDGNLRDWWTKDDHKNFAKKTKMLVDQYNAFIPVPGYHINGQLTLGENIADNSGLAIAYKAYKLSLGGKEAPVIDGLTGDQRFYTGFAQVWRGKSRDEATIARLKSDPHSPGEFRTNGTLRNLPGFYAAFDVKEGDKLYLKPEQRVKIW
jgi:putative endopeptidase